MVQIPSALALLESLMELMDYTFVIRRNTER
jgi:hypothetical protein